MIRCHRQTACWDRVCVSARGLLRGSSSAAAGATWAAANALMRAAHNGGVEMEMNCCCSVNLMAITRTTNTHRTARAMWCVTRHTGTNSGSSHAAPPPPPPHRREACSSAATDGAATSPCAAHRGHLNTSLIHFINETLTGKREIVSKYCSWPGARGGDSSDTPLRCLKIPRHRVRGLE